MKPLVELAWPPRLSLSMNVSTTPSFHLIGQGPWFRLTVEITFPSFCFHGSGKPLTTAFIVDTVLLPQTNACEDQCQHVRMTEGVGLRFGQETINLLGGEFFRHVREGARLDPPLKGVEVDHELVRWWKAWQQRRCSSIRTPQSRKSVERGILKGKNVDTARDSMSHRGRSPIADVSVGKLYA